MPREIRQRVKCTSS